MFEIHVMTHVDSSVLKLQTLLHKLKGRSGLNDVYQSSKTILTLNSVQAFVAFARDNQIHQAHVKSKIRSGPTRDIHLLGVLRLTKEASSGTLLWFNWPVGGTYDVEAINEDYEEPDRFQIDPDLRPWVAGDD